MEVHYSPEFLNDMDRLFSRKLFYRFLRLLKMPAQFLREAKWFIQRGRRGYSDQDVWNMHSHLVDTLPKMLRQMAKYANGCPSEIHDKHGEKGFEIWKEMLLEAADQLDYFTKIGEMEYMKDADGNDTPPDTWRPVSEEWRKEGEKGLEFIKQWFQSLWD